MQTLAVTDDFTFIIAQKAVSKTDWNQLRWLFEGGLRMVVLPYEFAENGIEGEYFGIASEDELLAGSGEHHVQLAVDDAPGAVGIGLHKAAGGEKL